MADKPHIMIVESRFYEDIAEELALGAIEVLEDEGVTYERIEVPGVFEIPAAIRIAIRSMDFFSGRQRFDGYIALGCVIRGETSHYDIVSVESSRKLQDLACDYTLAVGFGVLTCENKEQALERASREKKNKGAEAADACLHMIDLKREFRLFPR